MLCAEFFLQGWSHFVAADLKRAFQSVLSVVRGVVWPAGAKMMSNMSSSPPFPDS